VRRLWGSTWPSWILCGAALVKRQPAVGDGGRLCVPVPEPAMSLARWYANRMLRTAQRAQELVLSKPPSRVYSSQVAQRPR
jgi:hypothetical protein